jgi:2-hydroxy-6-oxonona-2,4-dienedioate hydrolase
MMYRRVYGVYLAKQSTIRMMKVFRVCLLLFAVVSFCGGGVAQTKELPFPESRFVKVGGVLIHYRHLPAADSVTQGTVLLIHGFAGSTYSWRLITDTLLASGFEVVMVDVPPFGYSDKSPFLNQSMSARALLLKSFMQQEFSGRKWHIAGHSMGGGMAEALVLMAQDEIEIMSLTIVDGVVFREVHPHTDSAPFILRSRLSRGIILLAGKPVLLNRFAVKKLLKSAYGRKPSWEETMGYLHPLKKRGTARAVLGMAAHYEELLDLHSDSLKVPVLAIWGDVDTWVPYAAYAPVVDSFPDSRTELIQGAAHCPMETHPEEFIKVFVPFLEVR